DAAAPHDATAEEGGEPDRRRREVLQRDERKPREGLALAEEAEDGAEAREPHGDRHGEDREAGGREAGRGGGRDAPERGVGDDREEPADGLAHAIRPRPAHLVAPDVTEGLRVEDRLDDV